MFIEVAEKIDTIVVFLAFKDKFYLSPLMDCLSITRNDQDIISYNIFSMMSSRKVMRIRKNINKGIISWSNIKFSKVTSQD